MRARADRLRDVRALLARPKGWIKKEMRKEVPTARGVIMGYCLLGAFESARSRDHDFFNQHMPKQFQTIIDFNDSPKTRKRDVLAALDRAIAAAEA